MRTPARRETRLDARRPSLGQSQDLPTAQPFDEHCGDHGQNGAGLAGDQDLRQLGGVEGIFDLMLRIREWTATVCSFVDAGLIAGLHVVVTPITLGGAVALWESSDEFDDCFHHEPSRVPAASPRPAGSRSETTPNEPVRGRVASSRHRRGPVSEGDRARPEVMAIHQFELDALA